MRTEFERPKRTENNWASTTGVAVEVPDRNVLSRVVFPSFWSNIRSLM